MVVRQHQAMGADERAGTAVVEAHTGQADVIEPRLRRREAITLLELLEGKLSKVHIPSSARPWGDVGNNVIVPTKRMNTQTPDTPCRLLMATPFRKKRLAFQNQR